MRSFKGHKGKLRTVAYSPDGSKLAAAGDAGVTKLWDIATGSELATIVQPEGKAIVDQVAFSPDGRFLATVADQVRVWDAKTFAEVAALPGLGPGDYGFHRAMVFTPDGEAIIASSTYSTIKDTTLPVWNWRTGAITSPYKSRAALTDAVAISTTAGL